MARALVPKTSGQGVSRIGYKTANALGNKGTASGAGEKFSTSVPKKAGRPKKSKLIRDKSKGGAGITDPLETLVGRDYAK